MVEPDHGSRSGEHPIASAEAEDMIGDMDNIVGMKTRMPAVRPLPLVTFVVLAAAVQ